MASDSEDSNVLEISSPETQFIEGEDDEETLWEVLEITGEKGSRYKVKWAGEDPKTLKPWAQSWVNKHDVTNDLVHLWKVKQAKKKKVAERRKSLKRESTFSKKLHASAASRTSATTLAGPSSAQRRGRSTATAVQLKEEPFSPPPTNGKRKHSHSSSRSDNSLPDIAVLLEDSDRRPSRKKRKVAQGDGGVKHLPKQVSAMSKPAQREEEEEEESSPDEQEVSSKRAIQKASAQQFSDSDSDASPIVTSPRKNRISSKRVLHDKGDDEVLKKKSKGKARAIEDSDVVSDDTATVSKSKKSLTAKKSLPKASTQNGAKNKAATRKPSPPAPKIPPRPKGGKKLMMDSESDTGPSTSRPLTVKASSSGVVKFGENFQTSRPAPKSSSSHRKNEKHGVVHSDNDTHPPTPPPKKPKVIKKTKAKAPPCALSPTAEHRLNDFDSQLMEYQDTQSEFTVDTEDRPGSFMFGESDMDTVAGELMYPVDQGASPLSKPKSKINGVRRDATLPLLEEFCDDDTVPETEMESQTQEHPDAELPRRPVTPSLSSLISKMKPKTPRSAGGSKSSLFNNELRPPQRSVTISKMSVLDDGTRPVGRDEQPAKTTAKTNGNGNQKVFRPIPILSPSKFTPHLPPSSLLESTIENADHEEEPTSSIEQFDTPVKKGQPRGGRSIFPSTTEKEKQAAVNTDPDFWSGDVVLERGQKLAEAAKLTRKQRTGGSRTEDQAEVPKLTINDIIATKSKSKSRSGSRSREPSMEPNLAVDETPATDDTYADQSGPHFPSQTQPQSLEQIETSFVDYTGGSIRNEQTQPEDDDTADRPNVLAIPQEEEESTQDILHEMEVQRAVSVASNSPPPGQVEDPDISVDPGSHVPETQDAIGRESEKPVVNRVTTVPSAANAIRQGTRSRSRSKAVSEGQAKHLMSSADAEIPPTATTHQESSQELSQSTGDRTDDEPQHLGAAMTLLNVKSDEIIRLEGLLAEERKKNTTFLQAVSSLREELADAKQSNIPASQPQPQPSVVDSEHGKQLLEARSLFAIEMANWKEEIFALNVSLKTANERKDLADKDCQFFREQYGQISAYVTQLQSEKKELEKELSISQSQAQNGVASIKTMFDCRLKSLEQDRNSWRRTAEFLIDKDRRTNDVIRQKAAEEPELRAKCVRLLDKLEITKDQVGTLEESVEEKEKEVERLESELTAKKDEILWLNLELNELKIKLERIGRTAVGGDSQQDDPMDNAHEFVYRCQWQPELGTSCEAVFLTIAELQEHLFVGGHLQRE